MTRKNKLGFPLKDLRMEFIVARPKAYVSVHWSKLEVRDLDTINNVWSEAECLVGWIPTRRENIPHRLITKKLGQIPALREHTANLRPNRMRDLGLIQYHNRERLRRKKNNTTG